MIVSHVRMCCPWVAVVGIRKPTRCGGGLVLFGLARWGPLWVSAWVSRPYHMYSLRCQGSNDTPRFMIGSLSLRMMRCLANRFGGCYGSWMRLEEVHPRSGGAFGSRFSCHLMRLPHS